MESDVILAITRIVNKALCSVQPYEAEAVEELILNASDKQRALLAEPDSILMQGDIISNIPFSYLANNGEVKTDCKDIMIISNTCDCQRDDNLMCVPLFERKNNECAKNINLNYELMAIDEKDLTNKFLDLSRTFSLNRLLILKNLDSGKSIKKHSLTLFGINLLYLKLTVFLMRPEQNDSKELRQQLFTSDLETD